MEELMRKPEKQYGALFEENYLLRTLGDIGGIPDVALSELVANAWDAGASHAKITIPDSRSETMIVEDDGCGLDEDRFQQRWMKLGYDRLKLQGPEAEFPPERAGQRRRAYGRNGQGRRGLLCFVDAYGVETWRDGRAFQFRVSASQEQNPFIWRKVDEVPRDGHGTRLSGSTCYFCSIAGSRSRGEGTSDD